MQTKNSSQIDAINERFLLACENGDLPLAHKMRDKGASSEARNSVGESAIHLAVKSGDVRLVDFVLQEMQTTPNLRDAFGRTALHWAAQQGNVAICESLLFYHVSVDAKDDMGVEAKIYAEMGGHRDIVKMFNLVRRQQKG